MPRWHVATQQWVREGRLTLLGIAQEQHSDRCRLFAQWKSLDFPIVHDPINVMASAGVPIIIALDEHGIVRAVGPTYDELEQEFVNKTFDSDGKEAALSQKAAIPDTGTMRTRAEHTDSVEAWRALGDALALWHAPDRLNDAIDAYSRALELDGTDGACLFRLGTCYSMRNESDLRRPGDFQRAVDKWGEALATDPNQYIWRRRIQQYGPQSDKPYPFYSWTDQAEDEIRTRGEEPVALRTPPTASEASVPSRQFRAASGDAVSPDPEGRIIRDTAKLVDIEVTIVPSRIAPGGDGRVHIAFRPNTTRKAHWNNEGKPLRVWVDLPDRWRVTSRLMEAPQPESPESDEVRRFDFGIQTPRDAPSVPSRLPAYALYYACEDVEGTCRFLRQDFDIEVAVGK